MTVTDRRFPIISATTPLASFLYGTAWKEGQTERLVRLALRCGYRGIDTANQRKHYFEAQVGAAVRAAVEGGELTREQLFLQSKFTFRDGQDHRLPYDGQAEVGTQVAQSFHSSLEHLHTPYLDAYLLHGPRFRSGLADEDWQAWKAMEALHDSGATRQLGISNVDLGQLTELCAGARVQPGCVQNRCYARTGWDRDVRAFCTARGIVYQGFSLLTANQTHFAAEPIAGAARRHHRTAAQVVFRFAQQVGMLPLTGSTDEAHLREDLEVSSFQLQPSEVVAIEQVAARG